MEGKDILLQILNGSAVTSSLALAESLKEEISEGEELLALYDKRNICSLQTEFVVWNAYLIFV